MRGLSLNIHEWDLAVLPAAAAALPPTLTEIGILILPFGRPATLLATTLLATLTALTTLPTLTALLLAIALPGVTWIRASHNTSNAKVDIPLWRTAFANVALHETGLHPSTG